MKIDLNNLFQLFAHTENSEWFSIIFVIVFEANIAAEQKEACLVTIFLFRLNLFSLPSTLLTTCPTAVPALDLFVKILASNYAYICGSSTNPLSLEYLYS